MYGIPDNFDPSFFVGATPDSISFGSCVINLHLSDPTIQVRIMGSYDHAGPDDAWLDKVHELPVAESRLMRIAGKQITAAVVESAQALVLTFADGQLLRILDDSEGYESFLVETADHLWVI